MMYSVKGAAFLVLTLGMSYVVSVLAQKEKGILKTVGYLVAIVTIIALIIGIAMPICRSSGIGCPIMKSIGVGK